MAMDHTNCDHPRTPAGRAWCRKNGGPGSGAVWGSLPTNEPTLVAARAGRKSPQTPVKATTARVVSGDTEPRVKTRTASLTGLPGTFRTAVDWAHANGCASAVLPADKGATTVRLSNDRGTLSLTWHPATPEGVHAVYWRPENTSVQKRLATVNEGLMKLKGE